MNIGRLALLAACGSLVVASAASAGSPCIDDAKGEAKECVTSCQEDFQAAKDACFNRDHRCVEGCRCVRQDCFSDTGIIQAFAACAATLAGAKQHCRDLYPPGEGRNQCIDQAQVVAFRCRLLARRTYGKQVIACRRGFLLCAKACPPPNPPTPQTDPRACRSSAVGAFVACRGGCIEDFQQGIDACRNKSHSCVEGCRDRRAVCRDPFEQARDADIAICNATRDGEVQNCRNLYGEGTQALATCIEDALVAAFECRDRARENQRQNFNSCRALFRSCLQECPPPS
jgi:hypothetical protein